MTTSCPHSTKRFAFSNTIFAIFTCSVASLSKVEEIIILGHSLAIDKNYLGLLKSKMPLLNKVILFKFEGEDVSEKIKSIYKIFGNIELIIKSYK